MRVNVYFKPEDDLLLASCILLEYLPLEVCEDAVTYIRELLTKKFGAINVERASRMCSIGGVMECKPGNSVCYVKSIRDYVQQQ